MRTAPWKVGELARRTGLTVRTLHHYDAIGLLSPSLRTDSGHRLYAEEDVERLQRIVSLRQLGLSLEEVRDCLADPAFSPRRLIRRHAERVAEQIDRLRRLHARLDRLAEQMDREEAASIDEILGIIEEITMFENHYTPEQLEQLKQRADAVGPERIRQVEAEWPALMAAVQAEMDRGTDPADPAVRYLAGRWTALVEEFTGGDAGIGQSLGDLWKHEPAVHGMDAGPVRQMMEYIGKAREASREGG